MSDGEDQIRSGSVLADLKEQQVRDALQQDVRDGKLALPADIC